MHGTIRALAVGLGLLLVPILACAPAPTSRSARSLLEIYDGNPHNARRYLPSLVTVPGLLGSQIVDPSDGRLYWGSTMGRAPKPTKDPGDARKLALPMALDTPIRELADELEAGNVLTTVEVQLATGPIQIRAYPGVFLGLTDHLLGNAVATNHKLAADPDQLAESGWATPFHGFAFDWRRDMTSQLEALDREVRAAADEREQAGAGPRTDIVTHSMGGLLVRYYLRYGVQSLPDDGSLPALTWAGAKYVDKAILIAPPNSGSPTVFENLVNGTVLSAFLPNYPAGLVGTFPGLYQMLPRSRHGTLIWSDDLTPVDVFDIELWRRYGWGLLGEDEDDMLGWLLPGVDTRTGRLAIADDHLRKCLALAEQFQRAIDLPARPPAHLDIYLFASDEHPTPAKYVVARDDGAITLATEALGDGSVTRASALADERQAKGDDHDGRLISPVAWAGVHWGTGDHLGITANIDFIDDLLYILLESPRR